MTVLRLDVDRPPPRPAGNLFRVAAAVAALSVPLALASYVLQVATGAGQCSPQPECQELILPEVFSAFVLSTTVGAEFVLVGCYVALATARGRLARGAALRALPAVLGVVILAVAGLVGWLEKPSNHPGDAPVGTGYLILLGLWVLAPLVLYGVHRGDRGAPIPTALALVPTAFVSVGALPKVPLAGLPPVMLVLAVVTVALVRPRR
ncbi:hypothetical protein [Kribbella sp. NPDC003557]|uniref:hypothetical protein n=1 Tax=Kribbella sp. NPDC003557 TaxID=3154449 RepID=UPI0033A3EAB8